MPLPRKKKRIPPLLALLPAAPPLLTQHPHLLLQHPHLPLIFTPLGLGLRLLLLPHQLLTNAISVALQSKLWPPSASLLPFWAKKWVVKWLAAC